MAKILKGKPLPHVVIVDTNILWHKDKTVPVNPDFDVFWADHKTLVDMELMIPEVVRGELLFQQVTSCLKLLDKVTEQISEISSIANATHEHRIKKEKINEQVTTKIDKWVKTKDAQVLPIPVSAINWKEVCECAIWRLKPFASDPKNPDNEKGFRDALIGETVFHFVANESRKVNIAFLCNDFLLRTSVAERLKTDARFACYESFVDFSSYIKLTREKLTNEFIKRIIQRAGEKFFKKGDPTCLWNKEGVYHKLNAEPYRFDVSEFNSLVTQDPGVISGGLFQNAAGSVTTGLGNVQPIMGVSSYPAAMTIPTWNQDGRPKWMLGTQDFQKITGDRTYHWKRPVTYICRYKSSYSTPSGVDIRGLFVRFNVLWKADVKDDARFHDISLEQVQFETREFRPLTEMENKWFE